MALMSHRPAPLSAKERQQRRRLLSMTFLTCLVLVMIGSTIHVVMLGRLRLGDMRRLATYDLAEERNRVRAAGEDIVLHRIHEASLAASNGYSVVEAQRLLSREQWEDLDSMRAIPAGDFLMGTDLERADPQDKPAAQGHAAGVFPGQVSDDQRAIRALRRRHQPPAAGQLEIRTNSPGRDDEPGDDGGVE